MNIRKKGLEIEQVKMEMYSTDQRVIDDLLEQVEYRFERNKSQGRYSGLSTFEIEERKELIYFKFNHDCQMWHYLKDKRPAYIDATKDVTNWILTLDFSFLEFDKFKQYKDTNNKITLCLHPNEFISMLQFWVPRTEKFENAILGNFRLPFLFKEVDGESEKVSLEILRAMSQYEDGGTFSSELVTEMLTNKALRQKIKVQNSVEENALLIKEELFAKYEATKNLLSKEKEEKNSLSKELNFVRSELSSLNKKIDILQEETHKKIEKELGLIRENQILELIKQKEAFAIKMTGLQDRLSDFEELIRKADLELEQNLKTFSSFFNEIFKGKEKHKSQMKLTIHKKYYDTEKYEQIRNEILHLKQLSDVLIIPKIEEKIIIYCENKNADYFNMMKFNNIHFIKENNSSGVYIKTVANPTHFGLRDRDYLTDREIQKLKKQHKNYKILNYYCYENYLFHPENLSELSVIDFDKSWYINELIAQKKQRYDKIVLNLKNDRNGYQEFKIPDNNIRENDEVVCEYLKSDDIEIFLKSYSLKTQFDKTCISKFQFTEEQLISTDWFRKKIEGILTI